MLPGPKDPRMAEKGVQKTGVTPLVGLALEVLCSISSFAGFEKKGVKVVSLHFARSYFCILTAGFKAYGIPNSS